MIKNNLDTIYEHLSGERALDIIKKITTFHRIQASPGYREAAEYCAARLNSEGIDAVINSYPARADVKYLEHRMFQEWSIEDAWLELKYPVKKRIADFKSNSLSVIQRSIPADYRNAEIDVVMLDEGAKPSDYKDVDLKGKIIFVHESFSKYMQWAIDEKGAIGIISDYMAEFEPVRNRNDLYDDLLYTSFWWQGEKPRMFGFVLSPRDGDRLRKLCQKLEADNRQDSSVYPYPKVSAFVDSKLYDGYTENVEAVIKGETDEEILAVAHLCHPRPSANDNASGAAAAMEAMKTINDLINTKQLKRPQRSIRLLLVPEFTGSYAFLSGKTDTSHIKAGINLDMVGGRQDKVLGPLLVCGLPAAGASFATDLADMLMEGLKRDVKIFFTVDTYVSCVNTGRIGFMSGSDNYIFSDPDIGVPMVALSQLPDKTYHTSGDTVDKIDPAVLRKSAAVCAAYLYTMATLTTEDAFAIMNKTRASMASEITKAMEENKDVAVLTAKVQYIQDVYKRITEDYRRFFKGNDIDRIDSMIESEKAYLCRLADSICATGCVQGEVHQVAGKIPVRKFRGPIAYTEFEKYLSQDLQDRLKSLQEKYKEIKNIKDSEVYSMLWCDGKRDLNDITRLTELECGINCREYVNSYFDILADAGLIAYR